MDEIGAFLHVRRDEREVFLELRITFPGRPHGVIEEHLSRLTLVPDKVYQPQGDQRPFADVEAQAIARFDRVAHADLRVAVFAVKQLEEKGGVIAAGGGQAKIVDRRDLLL